MNLPLRLPLAMLCALFLAACGQKEEGHTHAGGHVHVAPHGGALIEIGEHAYNLELLRDVPSGRLSAWILDGHAENFIRIKAASLEAVATVGAEKRPLSLRAVANPATGETVGDTAQFEVQADWLKTVDGFTLTFAALEIRTGKFGPITATFPKSAR